MMANASAAPTGRSYGAARAAVPCGPSLAQGCPPTPTKIMCRRGRWGRTEMRAPGRPKGRTVATGDRAGRSRPARGVRRCSTGPEQKGGPAPANGSVCNGGAGQRYPEVRTDEPRHRWASDKASAGLSRSAGRPEDTTPDAPAKTLTDVNRGVYWPQPKTPTSVSRRCPPSAARSTGSIRRRTPSATCG